MRLGIDASNLIKGGGVTHLVELLRAADPEKHGFTEVVVWSSAKTLAQLEDRPWLEKVRHPLLDGNFSIRAYWRLRHLPREARRSADVLFAPGGLLTAPFWPSVTMCRNMLMLDRTELARYGFSLTRLHLQLLKRLQKRSFAKADGLIFLSGFARDATAKFFGEAHKLGTVIPHGVNKAFFAEPEVQRGLTAYSRNRPFRWVYVSHIAPYKHHRRVVEALGMLRQEGLPVAVDLIGGAYPGSSSRALCKTMERVDPRREFVRLVGEIPYHDMPSRYHRANGAIYASSCENLPNILLESMAAGLPIACSNRPPMPETLGAGGVYFDPERPEEIANACRTLMADAALRETLAWKAYKKVQGHTWEHCADRTFAFLARVGRGFGKY